MRRLTASTKERSLNSLGSSHLHPATLYVTAVRSAVDRSPCAFESLIRFIPGTCSGRSYTRTMSAVLQDRSFCVLIPTSPEQEYAAANSMFRALVFLQYHSGLYRDHSLWVDRTDNPRLGCFSPSSVRCSTRAGSTLPHSSVSPATPRSLDHSFTDANFDFSGFGYASVSSIFVDVPFPTPIVVATHAGENGESTHDGAAYAGSPNDSQWACSSKTLPIRESKKTVALPTLPLDAA